MRDRRIPAVLAALALLGAACSDRGSREADSRGTPGAGFTLSKEQRQKVRTLVLAPRPFRRSIVTTGTVGFDADRATQVVSPISGPVSRLLVPLGVPLGTPDPGRSRGRPPSGAAAEPDKPLRPCRSSMCRSTLGVGVLAMSPTM